MKKAEGNIEKLNAIQEKYKSDIETCEKLYEGKTDEENKIMEAEMEKCADFKELKAILEME